MVSIQASADFCFKLLKIVPAYKNKKVTHTCVLQIKLQRRTKSHSTRTERSLTPGSNFRVSGIKRTGASSQLKELLPLQAQRKRTTFNPRALNQDHKERIGTTKKISLN